MKNRSKHKAVALISSGLDSMLAVKTVHDLGVDVTGLHCVFRFDPTADESAQDTLRQQFKSLGIPMIVLDVTDDFLQVVLYPEHGYGSEVNPCIDCKIFMFMQAKKVMQEIGASYLITGEVSGQRPMTQNKPMMYHIEKMADLKGLVVRPLTAKNLRETLPEQQGWIHRDKLYDFAGRGRKQQITLAKSFGIEHYNQPAGGCILTTPQYSKRAHALFKHRVRSDISISDMQLLRLGRHFWPNDHLHVIVGRSESDNILIDNYSRHCIRIEPVDLKGPVSLVENVRDHRDIEMACKITARYCRHEGAAVRMGCTENHQVKELSVKPFGEADIAQWRI